ncbi:hypothetical protein C8N35_10782 [Breoghania corrubedonensis]|uniref:Outer membrane beta-barrel porin/alpha-amylase n=1 Tax=Breoghania corrubedonensis TaxID=665038 RepID=A0A2T5V6J7_9HYPH|nr:transporter [Breoghania corrubedonensis]PTW59369.1 hypothetical protein C8N35_10782 [Breoghania corrubedonensis]
MQNLKVFGVYACLAAGAALLPMSSANAAERLTPMQPGGSTGNAAGALPPDGLYFSVDTFVNNGSLRGDDGKRVKPAGRSINTMNIGVTPTLLWVPGWEVLGARYGMAITQPYQHTETTGSEITDALFNLILTPAILSWDLGNGLFVGTGMNIYMKTGDFDRYANEFWTFEPNLAVSYLANGWNLTLNNTFDFNTKNESNDYQTGSFYYLDATATKRFGRWQVGAVANYTQQLEEDEQYGVKLDDTQVMHVMAGPYLSYDFDKFTVSARYLQNIRTENDMGVSFFHIGVGVPLYRPGK